MLDPKVQQKGGFGAFAARSQERDDVRAAARVQAAQDAATGAMPVVVRDDPAPGLASRADGRRAEKTSERPGGVR